jgi:hypothetical protein
LQFQISASGRLVVDDLVAVVLSEQADDVLSAVENQREEG